MDSAVASRVRVAVALMTAALVDAAADRSAIAKAGRFMTANSDIIDALTYASYRRQRLISPEVAPERWAKIYECDTAKMELKFQKENKQ